MKLWDRIWTTIFLIIVVVFSMTITYEVFFVKKNYLKAEEKRMDQIVRSYEEKLKIYLYEKAKLAKSEYLYTEKPIKIKLESQDTFVFVGGKQGTWSRINEEKINLERSNEGYFISSGNIIYGYVQEVGGNLYIFKLNKDEITIDPKWDYYDVDIEFNTESSGLDGKIRLEYDFFEKKYLLPVSGGRIEITLTRRGVLYNSVMLEGRKFFIIGLSVLSFFMIILVIYLERKIATTIKKAANKMDTIFFNDEISGDINLGKIPEFKLLEKGLNNIVKSFKEEKRKYKLLYDGLPLFSAILDLDLNIIEENEFFRKNLKKEEDEKARFLNYIPTDKVNLFTSIYKKLEVDGEVINENFYMIDKNSNIRMVLLTLKKRKIEDGKEVIFFTAIDTESLDIKQLENRSIEKYDQITNVYTEKYGHYYLEKYINMYKISNFSFLSVVIWTDFKELTSGLSSGNRLEYLKLMADSAKKCLRGTDLIYKFDRNSFALLLSMIKEAEVNIILRRIKNELEKNKNASGIKEEFQLKFSITEYDGMSSKKDFLKKQLIDVKSKK